MPNSKQLQMEDMSVAYVRALCAANGFSVGDVGHDNDGYDLLISCKGLVEDGCVQRSPVIRVQMKSSYAHIRDNQDGTVSYDLEVKNYNILIDSMAFIPNILIVLRMYEDESQWIEQNKNYLKITKCAYWKSLKGWKATTNNDRIAIHLTDDDLLTKDSLRSIMLKVAKGLSL